MNMFKVNSNVNNSVNAEISLKILQAQVTGVNQDDQNTNKNKISNNYQSANSGVNDDSKSSTTPRATNLFQASKASSEHVTHRAVLDLNNQAKSFVGHASSLAMDASNFKSELKNQSLLDNLENGTNVERLVKFNKIINGLQKSKQHMETMLQKLSDENVKQELYQDGIDVYGATDDLENVPLNDFLAKFWEHTLCKNASSQIQSLSQVLANESDNSTESEVDTETEELDDIALADNTQDNVDNQSINNMYGFTPENKTLGSLSHNTNSNAMNNYGSSINPVNVTSRLIMMFFMALQYTQQMVSSIEDLVSQVNEVQTKQLQDMGSMLSQFSQMYKSSIDLINSYLTSLGNVSTISSLDFLSPLDSSGINGQSVDKLMELFNTGLTTDKGTYGPSKYINIEMDPTDSSKYIFVFNFGIVDSSQNTGTNSTYVIPRNFAELINPKISDTTTQIKISVNDFVSKVLPVVTAKIYSATIMNGMSSSATTSDLNTIKGSSYYTNMSTLIGGSYSIDTAINNNAQMSKNATDRVSALQQYVSADNSSVLQMISTISTIIQQLGQSSLKLLT